MDNSRLTRYEYLHIVNTVATLSKGHPNIGCIVLQRRREKEKT